MNSLKNQRHELFCQYYVQLGNANKAYAMAGYQLHSGSVARLVKRPDIQQRIQFLRQKICEELEVTSERVLREYAVIAFSNLADYLQQRDNEGVGVKSLHALSKEQASAISEFKETETTRGKTLTFKLYDKMNALGVLSKHLGLFDDFGASKVEDDGISLKAFVQELAQQDQPQP